jgi:hypothetical protein
MQNENELTRELHDAERCIHFKQHNLMRMDVSFIMGVIFTIRWVLELECTPPMKEIYRAK